MLWILVTWWVILGWFILFQEIQIWRWTEILMKTSPVDPRDFFRGDYVVLGYEVAEIEWCPEWTIFIPLELDQWNIATWIDCLSNKPKNTLFIKWTNKNGNIRFGIEKYYVQEWKWIELEKAVGEMWMQVSIAKDWSARLLSHILPKWIDQ